MASDEERSEGGSRIYRYKDPPKAGEIASGDPENIDAITDHIERHAGKIETVFHEIVSPTIHVDVHHVPPEAHRPFHTLVTSGMSSLPMTVPDGLDQLAFAEVAVLLPDDWRITREAFEDERHYWPVRLLKVLARFPHEYSTWLGADHTMPNGDPPAPYADNTGLCGLILTGAVSLPEGFHRLELGEQRQIQFFTVVPLYADEMELKLEKGADALFDLFEKSGVSDIVDIGRRSVCERRGWWFS